MLLGKDKTLRFYRLLAGLGNYANEQWKISPVDAGDNYADGTDAQNRARVEILDAIWDRPEIIDEYLASAGKDLSAEDRETISGWKRFVKDKFVLVRNQKSGGVLLRFEDPVEVYLVQNFLSSWDELTALAHQRMPTVIEACLLPYDGVIVTDGFTRYARVHLGRGVMKPFKDLYMEQKAAGEIRKTL